MGLIILVLLVYFLGFKKYYICVNDTSSADREELTKILKYEFGCTLTEVKSIFKNTPYDLEAGTFLSAFTAKKKLQKTGADVKLFFKFLWQKKHEGPRNEPEPIVVNEVENPNEEAWTYVNEATNVALNSNNSAEESLEFASVDEAVEVDKLLDKAEDIADDPIEESFFEKVSHLRYAVSWALKRHWTHSWMIIGGVFLSILILGSFNSDNQSAVRRAENRLNIIKNWVEADTVFKEYPTEIRYYNDISNPKYAKSDLLCAEYEKYLSYTANAEEYKQQADTATVKSNKKSYLKSAKECEESAEKALKQYNKINKMDFDDIQDIYIDKAEDAIDIAEGDGFLVWFLFVTFLIMTPLYVMASYQYGYIITKHQKEATILEKIKKAGFGIAAGLFGAGLAMQFFPSTTVKTYWSDGSTSTHTEENPTNYIILALKIGLFILAVLVVCFVSCFLMTYLTITGLKRNYDWKAIYNKVKALKK